MKQLENPASIDRTCRRVRLTGFIVVVLGFASLLPGSGAQDHTSSPALKCYRATPGSKVTIAGHNGVHEWKAEGALLGGFLEIEPSFTRTRGNQLKATTIAARAEAFVPVLNLKATGKTWEPYNEQFTAVIHRMLKAEEHAKIYYSLTSLTVQREQPAEENLHAYEASGEMAIAGVTNPVAMPLIIKVLARGKLKISGTATVRQSDFKVRRPPEPERAVDDVVRIQFEWLVAEAG